MWVIVESITAGLIISLINKYIISKDVFGNCMNVQEEEDADNNLELNSYRIAVQNRTTDESNPSSPRQKSAISNRFIPKPVKN